MYLLQPIRSLAYNIHEIQKGHQKKRPSLIVLVNNNLILTEQDFKHWADLEPSGRQDWIYGCAEVELQKCPT